MDTKEILAFAEEILSHNPLDAEQFKAIARIPDHNVFRLLAGADMIRDFYFDREIHLCTICNGKSGRCSEDCAFCSQSSVSSADIPVYDLIGKDKLKQGGMYASRTPIHRYSIVTSGKRLSPKDVDAVAEALAELDQKRISTCASLGILEKRDFAVLKAAGVTRYHHNLETSESFFDSICTTHTYRQRIESIIAAKESGLSVCAGGVFGIGETDADVLELAMALRDLDVDAVSINFLVPIKGTPKENHCNLKPLRCLKIISIFRYVLPDKDIIICGGRGYNLKELHPLVFYAGASGVMTGNYLTTKGRTLEEDLEMINRLEFHVRKNPLLSK